MIPARVEEKERKTSEYWFGNILKFVVIWDSTQIIAHMHTPKKRLTKSFLSRNSFQLELKKYIYEGNYLSNVLE